MKVLVELALLTTLGSQKDFFFFCLDAVLTGFITNLFILRQNKCILNTISKYIPHRERSDKHRYLVKIVI